MSINNLSANAKAYYLAGQNSDLPLNIVNKLKSLGINPDEVYSINEAYNLIRQAEQNNKINNSEQLNNASNKRNNGENSDVNRDEALELARKVGVKVSDNDSSEDILANLKSYIDKMLKHAIDTYDKTTYDKFSEYKKMVKDLETKEAGGTFSNVNVFSFMDMVANQNKASIYMNKKEGIEEIE